jgi:hypothetical protein
LFCLQKIIQSNRSLSTFLLQGTDDFSAQSISKPNQDPIQGESIVANLNTLINRGVSRRRFLAGVGASAGAAAALGMAGCGSGNSTTTTSTTTPVTDEDILNFALNLEYLEASFYLYAATGAWLEAADTTAGTASTYQTAGTVTVGDAAAVPGLTAAQQQILNEIAFEEQAHVRFLRSALGSAAIPMPDIDLSFFGRLAYCGTAVTRWGVRGGARRGGRCS